MKNELLIKAQEAVDKDVLQKKAQEAIDDKIYDDDVIIFIKERWGDDIKEKELQFILNLMKGMPMYKAYMDVAGVKTTSLRAAKNQAYRWARKLNIDFQELLEYSGHGTVEICEALDNLKERDEDAYLRHITKLKKLDVQRVEHSGSIQIPTINIVTRVEDVE